MIAHRLSTVQRLRHHHHDGARPDRGARQLRRAPAREHQVPRHGRRGERLSPGGSRDDRPRPRQLARHGIRPQPVPADPARRARGRGGAGRELSREPRHRPRRPRRAARPLARQAVLGGRGLGRGGGADRAAPRPARAAAAPGEARLDGARPRAARRPLVQAPGLAALRRGDRPAGRRRAHAVLGHPRGRARGASGAGRKAARARLAPGLPRRGGRPRGPGGGARRSRLGRERAGLRLLRPAPALQGDRGPDRGLRRARRPGGAAARRRAPARPRLRRDPRRPRRRRRAGSA